MPNSVAEQEVEVTNAFGLHIQPAGMISKAAISFRSRITIIKGTDVANGRSIVDLTALGAGLGTRLIIRAEGPDAEVAVSTIAALFENKFGED